MTRRYEQTYELATDLAAPADRVWHAMKQPFVMLHVCRGLIWLPGIEGRIDEIVEGERGSGWIFALRIVPLTRYRIEVVEVDESKRRIVTSEAGWMVDVQHTATVEARGSHACRYRDCVRVRGRTKLSEAAVIAFAHVLYPWRQRRWRELAKRHLATPVPDTVGDLRGALEHDRNTVRAD